MTLRLQPPVFLTVANPHCTLSAAVLSVALVALAGPPAIAANPRAVHEILRDVAVGLNLAPIRLKVHLECSVWLCNRQKENSHFRKLKLQFFYLVAKIFNNLNSNKKTANSQC